MIVMNKAALKLVNEKIANIKSNVNTSLVNRNK